MSGKSRFKLKKLKAHVGEPRQIDAINAEYQPLLLKSGELQFKIEVMGADLKAFNKRLGELHMEANARKELDDKAKASDPAMAGIAPLEGLKNQDEPIPAAVTIPDDVAVDY